MVTSDFFIKVFLWVEDLNTEVLGNQSTSHPLENQVIHEFCGSIIYQQQ